MEYRVVNSTSFAGPIVAGANPPIGGMNFKYLGGTLLVFASGSGAARQVGEQIGMSVNFMIGLPTDTNKGVNLQTQVRVYSNQDDKVNNHKCFVPILQMVSPADMQTVPVPVGDFCYVHLAPFSGTITDSNDFFNLVIVELTGQNS